MTSLVACALGLAVLAGTTDSPLAAGFGMAEITPPEGFRRAGGYGEVIGTTAKDPLRVKALVVRQGDRSMGLLVFDLCGVFRELAEPIRARAARELKLPAEAVSVMATHTHGAPEYAGVLRDVFHRGAVAEQGKDAREAIDYQALLVDRAVAALRMADAARVPVTVAAGRTRVEGLAFNRRFHMKEGPVRFNPGKLNPDIVRAAGPVDPELPFIWFRAVETGRPVGVFTPFAMHVAVHGGPQFSADFPGVLHDRLRARFGPEFVSIFAEGTAGDINHVDVSTDRPDPTPEAIGQRLETAIVAALDGLKPVEHPELRVGRTIVPAALRPVKPEEVTRAEELLANLDRREVPFLTAVDAWRVHYNQAFRQRFGDALPMEVQGFALGSDLAIVTLPHEVFVEIGMAIRERSPYTSTVVASLANDMDFYVPTRRAFAEGSYEVTTCPLEPGCGEALVEGAVGLLERLRKER